MFHGQVKQKKLGKKRETAFQFFQNRGVQGLNFITIFENSNSGCHANRQNREVFSIKFHIFVYFLKLACLLLSKMQYI